MIYIALKLIISYQHLIKRPIEAARMHTGSAW